MAIRYICDRCSGESVSNELKTVAVPHTGDLDWSAKYDICQSCLRQLHEWLKKLVIPKGPITR